MFPDSATVHMATKTNRKLPAGKYVRVEVIAVHAEIAGRVPKAD